MSEMRVVLTTHEGGGAWDQTLQLANGLEARGHHVMIVHDGAAPSRHQVIDLRDSGVLMMYGGFAEPGGTIAVERLPEFHDWLARVASGFNADAIHCTAAQHVQEDPPATQTLFVEATPETLGEPDAGFARAVSLADRIVVPSQAVADTLAPYGRSAEVVHASAPNDRRIRTPDAMLLVTDRCLDPEGYAVLDEAMMGLTWRGEVPDETTGHRRLEGKGTLPRREEDALLHRAELFAAPGRWPSSGSRIARAAARGCPLLLSDIEAHREVWGDSAMYADPTDPLAWHEALQALSDAPSWRAGLAAKAQQRSRLLTTDAWLDRYEDLFARQPMIAA